MIRVMSAIKASTVSQRLRLILLFLICSFSIRLGDFLFVFILAGDVHFHIFDRHNVEFLSNMLIEIWKIIF